MKYYLATEGLCFSNSLYDNYCYLFKFGTCTDNLSFMLHKLVFLGYHSHFALYPYSFALYNSYSCKILRTIRCGLGTELMHSNTVLKSVSKVLSPGL